MPDSRGAHGRRGVNHALELIGARYCLGRNRFRARQLGLEDSRTLDRVRIHGPHRRLPFGRGQGRDLGNSGG